MKTPRLIYNHFSSLSALLITAFFAALAPACNSSQQQDTASKTIAATPVAFVPPPDCVLSETQARAWLQCSRLLDSLSHRFHKPLSAESIEERQPVEKAFNRAQDSICVVSGLAGGYVEYRWITKNIHREPNRRLLDSMGLSF